MTRPGFTLLIAIVAKCEEIMNVAQKIIISRQLLAKEKWLAKFFLSDIGSSPPAKSHCFMPLNGHQCIS